MCVFFGSSAKASTVRHNINLIFLKIENSLNILAFFGLFFLLLFDIDIQFFNVHRGTIYLPMEFISGIEPLTSCVQSRRSPSELRPHKTSL